MYKPADVTIIVGLKHDAQNTGGKKKTEKIEKIEFRHHGNETAHHSSA